MAKLKGKAKAAFLAKMARGRNKTKKSSSKRKHKAHKEHHVKRRTAKHHKTAKRRGTRRRHHAAGFGKYLPSTDTLIGIGSSFAYGKVEAAARKDDKHFLKSVPALVPQIGRAGNLGALLWLGGVVTKHRIVKSVAAGVLHVAAYQNSAGAEFTKDSQDFKMGAPAKGRRDEILVEEYLRKRG